MNLRSNLTPGTTEWAVRRAQWRAMGIDDADLEKPKIAIVNSSSQLSICFTHLDEVAREVAAEIRAAGGLPFEIRTAAPSDFITSAGRQARYLMPTRDLVVNDIEVQVEGALLDGMVCLSSCDKTTPAHLMAAGRLDVPTVVVIGGYQAGGWCEGVRVDIDDVYEQVGAYAAGKLDLAGLTALTEHAVDGPGVCAGLGTANTMHILAEALGMTMPGSAPVRAGSETMLERARAAGRAIVSLIANDQRPRAIMTREAFENAVVVDLAIAGSVNSARHLQAIAVETGVDVDIYGLIERLSLEVPMVCAVRPNGLHHMEDLERAGGARAVLARLRDRLHVDVLTVTGRPLGDVLAGVEVEDDTVIRPVSKAFRPTSGLTLVRGSLAPDGAIVKIGAVPAGRERFTGSARVFATEDDAKRAIGDGSIAGGDVVVLAGFGPKGGPGTVFAAGLVAALNGAGLASEVAVVTDGELSGLNRGITIGQVMPEAAEGGPLALVREGDTIVIDLVERRVDLDVDAAELASRRSLRVEPPLPTDRSWLTFYRHLVQPLSAGAVLGPVTSDE